MVSFTLPAALLPGKGPHYQLEIGCAPRRPGRAEEYIKSCPCRKSNDSWHVQAETYSLYLLRHQSVYMLTRVFSAPTCLCPNTGKRDERFIVATTGPFILDTVSFAVIWNVVAEITFHTRGLIQNWRVSIATLKREDNIKMNLKINNKGWCRLDSSGTGQNKCRALISTVMNLRVP